MTREDMEKLKKFMRNYPDPMPWYPDPMPWHPIETVRYLLKVIEDQDKQIDRLQRVISEGEL